MNRDTGLDTLFELDGSVIDQGEGYWIKIEVTLLDSQTKERPHGIRYSLTLHDPYNRRILGYDNSHAVKKVRGKYAGRKVEYDHVHKNLKDKGSPYEFKSPYQLLHDFFDDVDKVLKRHKGY